MKTHYGPFSELLHSARTGDIAAVKYLGKPFFEWISESPRLAEIQNAAMVDGGRSARGDLLAAYKLPGSGTVADIGVRTGRSLPVGHKSTHVTETVYRHVIVPEIRSGASVMDNVFDDNDDETV
jgi:hypothetical protein